MEKITESERAKILALSEIGYSNVKIAKLQGINEKSVRNIKKEYEIEKVENSGDLARKQSDISEIKEHFFNQCKNKLNLFSEHMTEDKAKKASLKDLAVSYAIMYDKMSLAGNLSTQNIDHKYELVNRVRLNQVPE